MASSTTEQPQSSRLTGKLVLVEGGEDVPRNILLYDKDIIVGRGCGCNVTLGSLQISRKHATLEYLNNKWFIRDASTNGISVGTRDPNTPGGFVSSRLVKGVLQELKDRDLIHLIPTGSLIYRFELPENQPNSSAQQTKTENVPEMGDLQGALGEDSNESQSLLSISGNAEDCFHSINNPVEGESGLDSEVSTDSGKLGCGKRKKPGEMNEFERVMSYLSKNKRPRPSVSEEDRKPSNAADANNEKSSSGNKAESDLSVDKNLSPSSIENCSDLNTLKTKYIRLCAKFRQVQTVAASLRLEKKMAREEFMQKQNDAQSKTEAYKEELFKKIIEVMEQEFSCCVCNEVFVTPTVVDCGHTFCQFCITEWARKKPECPICRKYIRNQTKHVEMDNYITKLHTLLSDEIKVKRDNLVSERKVEREKAQLKLQAESRGRRGAVPNADFAGYPFPQAATAFDLLQELQNINDQHWPPAATIPPNTAPTGPHYAAQRRSSRIQTRNQPAGETGRRRGDARRYNAGRPRHVNMDVLGMNRPIEEVIREEVMRELEGLPRAPPPQQTPAPPVLNPNQQQPNPGLYPYPNPGNGAMPVPNFLENTRNNFFPMFPFGGMGRQEAQPVVSVGPPRPITPPPISLPSSIFNMSPD